MDKERQDKSYVVYCHTCPNGKKYIGITCQKPEKRWQGGYGYAYGNNQCFHNAIKKYGWNNIKHDVLFSNLLKEEAEEIEIELISKFKTTDRNFGYNIDPGGFSTPKHTEEYKKAMSERQKDIWKRSPERREKLSRLRRGKSLSEETKEKIRQANIGKKYSKEVGEKRAAKQRGVKRPQMSSLMKELWKSGKQKGMTGKRGSEKQKEAARKNIIEANKRHVRPVLQYDMQGNFIAEYESGETARAAIGHPYAQICDVCNGRRKSTYGFVFKYKEE